MNEGHSASGATLEIRTTSGLRGVSQDEVLGLLERSEFVHWYDGIVDRDPATLSPIDLAYPAFLDAVPDFKVLLQGQPWSELESKLRGASDVLAQIPMDRDLMDWPDTQENRGLLLNLYRSCLGGDNGSLLGFGPARCTKLLHKKRPRLVPILDSYQLIAWDYPDPARRWRSAEMVELTFRLGQHLGAQMSFFRELRPRLAELGAPYESLSEVRIYDIIVYQLSRPASGNH